jgi:hypothetical protein
MCNSTLINVAGREYGKTKGSLGDFGSVDPRSGHMNNHLLSLVKVLMSGPTDSESVGMRSVNLRF